MRQPPPSTETTTEAARAYFTAVREGVDGFATEQFGWRGTLALHRHALGSDILRAPLNVLLSPVLVLTRLLAALCSLLRLRRAAQWLRGRRIVLRTQVAAQVEAGLVTELLGVQLPVAPNGVAPDSTVLSGAILAAPQFRACFRAKADLVAVTASVGRIVSAIAEYSSARSAVADITTALLALSIGGLVFQAVTPGMISMAPTLAGEVAVVNFPLGQTAGAMWYGVFNASASPWLLAGNVAALLLAGSVIGAFAGILADPVQVRLGIHRRRLVQFVDAVEDDLLGTGQKGYTAREHFYARFMDVGDAVASVLRIFRS
jgi:hypothetical protein